MTDHLRKPIGYLIVTEDGRYETVSRNVVDHWVKRAKADPRSWKKILYIVRVYQ